MKREHFSQSTSTDRRLDYRENIAPPNRATNSTTFITVLVGRPLLHRVLIGALPHIHTSCTESCAGTRAVSTYPPNGC